MELEKYLLNSNTLPFNSSKVVALLCVPWFTANLTPLIVCFVSNEDFVEGKIIKLEWKKNLPRTSNLSSFIFYQCTCLLNQC